jgi:hypothetical protein
VIPVILLSISRKCRVSQSATIGPESGGCAEQLVYRAFHYNGRVSGEIETHERCGEVGKGDSGAGKPMGAERKADRSTRREARWRVRTRKTQGWMRFKVIHDPLHIQVNEPLT